MKRRRWKVVAINAVLVLVLVGVGVFAYRSFAGKSTNSTASGTLQTTTVASGTVVATVSASGTVVSPMTLAVSFVAGGTVTGIRVRVGQHVTKDQILARVDPTMANANLASAQAGLLAADDNLSAVESGASPTTAQISQAKAQVTQAQVTVAQAQAQVTGTELRAPMTGTVTVVSGIVGQTVASGGGMTLVSSSSSSGTGASSGSSGTGFVQIADLAHLEVSTDFSETDASKLKTGQAATVTLDAAPDQQLTGKVRSIDLTPTTVNNVVDYGVTIGLTGATGVRLGETAEVSVVTGRADNALYVPSAAVQSAGGTDTVTLLVGGRQVQRTVQVGLEGDQTTQILSGLAAGDVVVIPTTTGSSGFPTGGFPGGRFGGGLGGGTTGGGGTRVGTGG